MDPKPSLAPELSDALAELQLLTGQKPEAVQKKLAGQVRKLTLAAREAAADRGRKLADKLAG